MGMHSWLQWMHWDLTFCSCIPTWADYRTDHNIIAANYSAFGYFVAPSKPCKWSCVLAQAIQLTAVQNVDVNLFYQTSETCYNEQTVTQPVHLAALWASLYILTLCMLCLIFKSCTKLNISNYCIACYNNAVYTILSYRLLIIIPVLSLQYYS